MGKVKSFIKKQIEYSEAWRRSRMGYLEGQLKLCPVKYHDKYKNSFEYIRYDFGIKLCELKIEILKSLIGGKRNENN